MAIQAPKIDERTAADIANQVRELLKPKPYVPDWKEEFDATTGKPTGVSTALIGIFSRFAEIIIERLNRVPEKNFLAFLDLLGNSLQPPQPARVPVTFSLAAGSVVDAVVPAGTQVAAPPAEGQKDSVIFETERELTVMAARIATIFVCDPRKDCYSNHSDLDVTKEIDQKSLIGGKSLLDGDIQIKHSLYLGEQQLLGLPSLNKLTVSVKFCCVTQVEMDIRWEYWDGIDRWKEIGLTRLEVNQSEMKVEFDDFQPLPLSMVFGQRQRWLRGTLVTPTTKLQMEKVSQAEICSLGFTADIESEDLPPDYIFTNLTKVDPSQNFLPFGGKPGLGDSFLLCQNEAFGQSGATITLSITLANPASIGSGATPTQNVTLSLESWDGRVWCNLGTTGLNNGVSITTRDIISDSTFALTKTDDAKLVFRLTSSPPICVINGIEGRWLRLRLSGGDYGTDAQYIRDTLWGDIKGYVVTKLADFHAPVISSIQVSYKIKDKIFAPQQVITNNNFEYLLIPGTVNTEFIPENNKFHPFVAVSDSHETLYLGFTIPREDRFPQCTISMYFGMVEPMFGQITAKVPTSEQPRLSWEYSKEQGWGELKVRDDTAAFIRSGLIEFLPPADFAAHAEFGQRYYWIRASLEEGDYQVRPCVRAVLLNTTMAAQTVTLRDETPGSSDGSANQKFHAVRAPILEGPVLEVREGEKPSAEEIKKIVSEEGNGAITEVKDAAGNPKETWIRWHQVPDFYASGPRDRHYVLDHLTGEIRFGDGIYGLIPPIGVGNLRLKLYQTGGGKAGNVSAGAIIQMKTTVPYVDKVTNYEPAAGGADAETTESLIERAPRRLRHRDRAVTREDFEDLAKLASPEVARARCEPLLNLTINKPESQAGVVSVVIVPKSQDPQPMPSVELINRVREFLDRRRLPTSELFVVGPEYVEVNVTVDIALVSMDEAGKVKADVRNTLSNFLHPLTGGLDGKGWDFGREPYKSDLYALIETIPGVDHIRSMGFTKTPDTTLRQWGLVSSGTHRITLTIPTEEF